jgi:hypothetical protein
MAVVNNNQNTQQPRKKPVTIGGYPEAVHDLMRAKYPDYDQVMNGGNGVTAGVNGGAGVNFFGNGGGATGKFEAQPVQTGAAPITDFTQMPKQEEFVPQGSGNANPALGPVQTPYMGDAAENTPQPQSNFEGMPQPSTGWNADGTPRYDTLSTALSGFQMPKEQQVPEFEADPKQRDGGFFSWLGKIIPKSRPGMREGETPDEYDRRITTNRERIAAFADAIRHMANIVNTSNGAPLQVFNDPTAMMEQGYQNRKAQRQKQAALDADAAYKQADLYLKSAAARAKQVYQETMLGYKQKAEERAAKNDEFERNYKTASLQRLLDNDKFNHELSTNKFNETARHNKVSESQGAIRIALAQERNNMARTRLAHSIASGGGGGKSGKLTNLSSPTGHLNRTYDLNAIEKKQITQHLIKNGYINKTNLDAWTNYVSTGDTKNANDLQNYWIAYAANMPGKKGDAFRTMLKNHYMYNETSTTSAPKATRGSVVTITQKGNKVKNTKNNTVKNKFHVD